MNALVPMTAGRMPSVFANRAGLPSMNSAAQQGLPPSFAVIGFKGRNWRLKYRGDETLVKDDRGGPAYALDVVIVGVSPAVTKQFYDKKYAEGDDAAPDCFSLNGVTPDPTSPKLQSQHCATCQQNVYGSRLNENGKKAKACADSRRLAVVPTGDIDNDSMGGPMLLRLPPMSLVSLARYANELTRFAAEPYMVNTILTFDQDVAYPLIDFKAAGWLTDEQAHQVAAMLENPLIGKMLDSTPAELAGAAPAPSAAASSPLATGAPAKSFAPAGVASTQASHDAPSKDPALAATAADVAAAEKAIKAKAKAERTKQLAAELAAVEAAEAEEAEEVRQEALGAAAAVTEQPAGESDEEREEREAEDAAAAALKAVRERMAARTAAATAKAAAAPAPALAPAPAPAPAPAAKAAPKLAAVVTVPPAKRTPFQSKVAAATQVAQPAAGPAADGEDRTATTAAGAVPHAPADLESAIDQLLG